MGQHKGLLEMTPGFRGPERLAMNTRHPKRCPFPQSRSLLTGPREEGGRPRILFGAQQRAVSAEHKRFYGTTLQWGASFSGYKGPYPAPRPVPALPHESLGGRQEWQLTLMDPLGAESRRQM